MELCGILGELIGVCVADICVGLRFLDTALLFVTTADGVDEGTALLFGTSAAGVNARR